jgi:hypothetical protein
MSSRVRFVMVSLCKVVEIAACSVALRCADHQYDHGAVPAGWSRKLSARKNKYQPTHQVEVALVFGAAVAPGLCARSVSQFESGRAGSEWLAVNGCAAIRTPVTIDPHSVVYSSYH